jgi:hypothetical protein
MMAGLVTVGPLVSPERAVDPAVVTGATIIPDGETHLASPERVALDPEAGTAVAVGDHLASPVRVDLAVVIGVTIIPDGETHLESPVRAVDLTATAGTAVAVGLLESLERAADLVEADGEVTVGPLVSLERAVDHTAAGAAAVGPLLESLARAVDLTAAGAATVGPPVSPERAVDLVEAHGEVTVESLARAADHMATLET